MFLKGWFICVFPHNNQKWGEIHPFLRACLISRCVRIFEHNFAEGKAKKRKHTDVW